MTTAETGQPIRARKRPRYENTTPTHDLTLTAEYLAEARPKTVLSVLARFGTDGRVPITVEKRWDGVWEVHSRSGVAADRLVGGDATPRRRIRPPKGRPDLRARATEAPATSREALVSFADAVARMAGARPTS